MHGLLPGLILINGMISVDHLMHAPSVARSDCYMEKKIEFMANTTNHVQCGAPFFLFLEKSMRYFFPRQQAC
jgi:hypothetical protein